MHGSRIDLHSSRIDLHGSRIDRFGDSLKVPGGQAERVEPPLSDILRGPNEADFATDGIAPGFGRDRLS